jgi:hypothetical protein
MRPAGEGETDVFADCQGNRVSVQRLIPFEKGDERQEDIPVAWILCENRRGIACAPLLGVPHIERILKVIKEGKP